MDRFIQAFFLGILYVFTRPPIMLFTVAVIAVFSFCWGFVAGFNYLG